MKKLIAFSILCSSIYCCFGQTDLRKRIIGSWRPFEDTTIIVQIEADKWAIIQVEHMDTSHYISTLSPNNSKGKDVYFLTTSLDTLQYRVDGLKGPDLLYLTEMRTNQGFGMRRIYRY